MKKKEKIVLLEFALKDMLNHYDNTTCLHETTYRGGAIWTICEDCGRKWADDEGGFIPYMEPLFVSCARELLEGK
jgi:ribosomal protein L37AE/L43A